MLRTIGVVVLALLLVVSLAGANAVLGVERGPLNAEHTSDSLDRVGFGEFLHDRAVEQVSQQMEGSDVDEAGLPADEIVSDAVSPEWIQTQIDRNIADVYAYLHGDREDLRIELDLESLRASTKTAFREHVDLATLAAQQSGDDRLAALLESEDSYNEEREAIRDELLREMGVAPSQGFGRDDLAAMIESEEGYQNQRETFRQRIVDEILVETQASEGFGHERLDSLLESEDSYEQEQMAFREEQKERIQNETSREYSDEELEQIYEDRQDEIIANTSEVIAEEISTEDLPEGYDPPVDAFANLTAHGFGGDMSYDTYVTRYEEQVTMLESDLKAYIATSGDELHDDLRDRLNVPLSEHASAVSEDDIAELKTLILSATTTDMDYATFESEYWTIADRLVEDVTTELWENREDYEEINTSFISEQADVPEPLAEELVAAEELIAEAILTDLDYETFNERLETIEADATEAFVDYLFDQQMPVNGSEEVASEFERQAGQQLSMARTVAGATGPVGYGLLAIAVLLAGAIALVARSYAGASVVIGLVSSIVGGVSLAGVSMAPSMLSDLLADADVPPEAAALLPDLVAALLGPLRLQSLALLVLGIGLVGLAGVHRYTDLLDFDAEEEATEE